MNFQGGEYGIPGPKIEYKRANGYGRRLSYKNPYKPAKAYGIGKRSLSKTVLINQN